MRQYTHKHSGNQSDKGNGEWKKDKVLKGIFFIECVGMRAKKKVNSHDPQWNRQRIVFLRSGRDISSGMCGNER